MFNLGSLSLDQSPPPSVPLRFFLTAPLFAAAAGLLLAFNGEAVLSGRWGGEALALTHLITLGVLAMVMFGAMMQFLPVATGAGFPRPRVIAGVVHPLLACGAALLAWGLWRHSAGALTVAAVALAGGIALFVGAALFALLRSRTAYATVTAVRLALVALTVTAGLGIWLALGHAQLVPLARQWTDLHLTWGVAGWVGLLIAGVAFQVVPLFQITADYPAPVQRWLPRGVFAGLVLLAIGGGVAAAAVIALTLAAFGGITLRLQYRRKRRLRDASLGFWRMGLAALIGAVALWAAAQLTPGLAASARYPLLLGMLAGLLFPLSIICGMLYKIVPFLVWLHLHNRAFRTGSVAVKVPNMKEVISERRARLHLALHAAAALALLAAPFAPTTLAPPAGLLFAAAALVLGANLLAAAGVYRATTIQFDRRV